MGERLIWRLDWKTTIQRTIRAVVGQSCELHGLVLNEESQGDSMVDSSLCTDDVEHQLRSACSHWTHPESSISNEDIETTTRSLKRIVSVAKNLKFLYLYEAGPISYSSLHCLLEVLKCVVSSSLEETTLTFFEISESELHEFIGKSRTTLKVLRLWSVCLLSGSCMSLLAWIKDDMPDLLHLDLHNFCDHCHRIRCQRLPRSFEIGYNEDMQACLADILNEKKRKKKKN